LDQKKPGTGKSPARTDNSITTNNYDTERTVLGIKTKLDSSEAVGAGFGIPQSVPARPSASTVYAPRQECKNVQTTDNINRIKNRIANPNISARGSHDTSLQLVRGIAF
jgi:hypothetical protein